MPAKTVIVTGASRGIGLAIASYLISNSHNVVILARSREVLENIQKEHPKQVRILAGNLGDFSIASEAVNLAVKEFGQLDGLVVNHGIMDPVSKIEDCNPSQWRELFDVNFFSAIAFAKAALPALRKTQGCIILTSSGASTGVYSSWGAYGASKAAMNHFAKQLACEEPDVTSISVKPGVVDTNMQKELREVHSSIMAEKDNAKFMGLHKEGKLLKPEQPGFLMARLVLDPPNELSGQCLSWDSKELAGFQG